jgi:hypothetical protein
MTVNTYRMTRMDFKCLQDYQTCPYCDRDAHYWSQNEGKGYIALGPVVYHCQVHRKEGREAANVILPTPGAVFRLHYGERVNPMTPITVERGWIRNNYQAFELSTNEARTYWGVTVVAYEGKSGVPVTWEVHQLRYSSQSEDAARNFIKREAEFWAKFN